MFRFHSLVRAMCYSLFFNFHLKILFLISFFNFKIKIGTAAKSIDAVDAVMSWFYVMIAITGKVFFKEKK